MVTLGAENSLRAGRKKTDLDKSAKGGKGGEMESDPNTKLII